MYRRYAETGSLGGASSFTIGSGVMASTAKTLLMISSTAAIRPYIYDFTFGTIGTPSDSVVTVVLTRFSTATATLGAATTPSPLDTSDAVAITTALGSQTVEGTAGVTLFQVGLNVRATYRWVAAPGGELICAAGAGLNASIRLAAYSPAYVLDATTTIYHAE